MAANVSGHTRLRTAAGLLVALGLVTPSACSDDERLPAASTRAGPLPTECADVSLAPCDLLVTHLAIPLDATSWSLVYSSDRVPGRRAEPMGDVRGLGLGGWMLNDVHELAGDVLLLGDGGRRIVTPIPGASGEQIVASVDGNEAYVFDRSGHHLRTVSTNWGTITLAMSYDDGGRLSALRDVYGDDIRIERDPSNMPIRILGAGIDTSLTTNARGYLTTAIDRSGAVYTIAPDPDGLVTIFDDVDGRHTTYEYDIAGRLTATTDASGARWTATWTDLDSGHRIEHTAPTGETTSLTVERIDPDHVRTTVESPDGRRSVADSWADGRRRLVAATGGQTDVELAPDPRFGMSAPIVGRLQHRDASGSSEATTEIRVEGLDGEDPLALRRMTATVTDAGATTSIVTDRVAGTQTSVAPGGETAEIAVDSHGDVVQVTAAGQEPTTIVRDAHGAILSVQRGSDAPVATAVTDPATGAATITDALGRTTTFRRDHGSGSVTIGMADGRSVTYRTTAGGTPAGAEGPAGATEVRTSDARGLLTGGASSVSGLAVTSTTRDGSGRIAMIERTDGRSITVGRDDAGRIESITTPAGLTTYSYDGESGLVTDLLAPGDVGLHRTYAGATLAKESLTGPVTGSVAVDFDELGRPRSLEVAGLESTIDYDGAGRVRSFGPVEIAYDPDTGSVAGRVVDEITTSITHDAAGRQSGQAVAASGRELYREAVTFDSVGRVATRTETLDGVVSTTTFGYDLSDRLTSVSVDGGAPTTYTYDDGDNLVQRGGPAPTTSTYDATGHVERVGDDRYTFSAAGVLASTTTALGTATYDYDVQGRLRAVVLPDGRAITYLIDAVGRRVGKEIDGTLVAGWLYDGLEVVAELDGSGNVVARYVDGVPGAPQAMTVDDRTLSIVTDRWGSPRLILDAATGEVVDRIERDVWGAVTAESSPGTTSLGFLGGIADPDTGLVHLGARDYDPAIGRFTTPDPAGIHGLRTNLYVYAGDNPVNRVDADGWSDDEVDERNNDALLGLLGDLLQAIGNMGGITNGGAASNLDLGQLAASVGSLANSPSLANAAAGVGNLVSAIASFAGAIGAGGDALGVVGKAITFSKSAADLAGVLTQAAHGNATGVDVVRAVVKVAWDAANLLQAMDAVYGDTLMPWLPSALGYLGAIGLGLAGACFLACRDSQGRTGFNDLGRRIWGPSYDWPDGPTSPAGKRWRKLGKAFGDPHLLTLDGSPFDFQAVGEFVLVRSTVDDFTVQIRTAPIAAGASISVVVGAAIGTGAHRVTWVAAAGTMIDGEPMMGAVLQLADGTTVSRTAAGAPTVVLADGSQVEVHTGHGGAVVVGLADGRLALVEGLLGNADDDPDNDLVVADRAPIDQNDLADVREMADAWRVTEATSLFDYAAGTDTTTFTDRAEPRDPATLANLEATARAAAATICTAAGVTEQPYLDACVLDVALTGDVSYAVGARTMQAILPTDSVSDVERRQTFAIEVGDVVAPGAPSAGAGVIEGPTDVDAYTFTVSAATTVTVTADLSATPAGSRSGLDWEVAAAAGTSIDHGSFDGDPASATGPPQKVSLPVGDDYTLIVRRHDDGDAPLEYGFTLSATTSGTTSAQAGEDYSGSIDSPGDTRDFELTVAAGQALAIENLQPCDFDANLSWSIVDQTGERALLPTDALGAAPPAWRSGDFCGDAGRLEFPSAGTYRFRVTTTASNWTGAFSFRVTTPRDDRFAIGVTDDVSPGSPGPGAGNIESQGSLDVYTFELGEPAFYRLDTTPTADECTEGAGPMLTLYAPSGASVAPGVIPTCAGVTTLHLTEVGTYTVVVGSYVDDGAGIATGTYRFQFTR